MLIQVSMSSAAYKAIKLKNKNNQEKILIWYGLNIQQRLWTITWSMHYPVKTKFYLIISADILKAHTKRSAPLQPELLVSRKITLSCSVCMKLWHKKYYKAYTNKYFEHILNLPISYQSRHLKLNWCVNYTNKSYQITSQENKETPWLSPWINGTNKNKKGYLV